MMAGTVIGSVGKIYSWLRGGTKVTPQTALNYWRLIDTADYAGATTRTYQRVTRDHVTGAFFYNYQVKANGVVVIENNDPFLILWVGRGTISCM